MGNLLTTFSRNFGCSSKNNNQIVTEVGPRSDTCRHEGSEQVAHRLGAEALRSTSPLPVLFLERPGSGHVQLPGTMLQKSGGRIRRKDVARL